MIIIRLRKSTLRREGVCRTAHLDPTVAHDVRMDHGGLHLLVPHQLLNHADIACFQQVCGEGMREPTGITNAGGRAARNLRKFA